MKVNWITITAPRPGTEGGLASDVASLRYRVLAPIRHLAAPGHAHTVIPVNGKTGPASDAALDADLVVFSKSHAVWNAELARRAQARGVPVIFDVCDNHFDTAHHPEMGPHYREMAALADQVVCNTQAMALAAQPFCATPPVVIEDPYEGPRGAPAFAPGQPMKVLWFGHETNLDTLPAACNELTAWSRAQPVALHILTQINPTLEATCARATASLAPAFSMTCEAWSQEAQWRALADCDLVIIPSLPTEAKLVKSANRIVEALWAGRPAVAHALPAYEAFAAWTPVGESLTQGLAWLEQNRAAVPGLLTEAQAYIAARHAPAVLAEKWAQIMDALCARQVLRA